MAVSIDPLLCRGCGACVGVCPGDLLYMLDGRAVLREDNACWNCFSCAKSCPSKAIRGLLPFVIADAGASLWPEPTTQGLRWVCTHPDGRREVLPLEQVQPADDGGVKI